MGQKMLIRKKNRFIQYWGVVLEFYLYSNLSNLSGVIDRIPEPEILMETWFPVKINPISNTQQNLR